MPPRPLVVPKVRRSCELILQDGTRMRGDVFVEATERIQDMLNDARDFFPFTDENGGLQFIAKNSISRVIVLD